MYINNCHLDESNGQVVITGQDIFSGKPYRVGPVSRQALDQWLNGALIQIAFPDLSSDDREFLISGITPETWGKTFERRV